MSIRCLTLFLALCISQMCTAETNVACLRDSLQTGNMRTDTLSDVTVKGERHRQIIESAGRGSVTWNMRTLDDLPKILGNADPVRYTQTLPGVQTNKEYDAGIHVFGCDSQHNMMSINGVPLFNANHLMGLFSTFNPSHFSTMTLTKAVVGGGAPNRIGGQLDMESQTQLEDTTNGELAVGLISSQGTVRLPLGKKSTLILSGRLSYLNLLYGYALKADESQFGYSFGDANATYIYKPDERNDLRFDFYYGSDNLKLSERNYLTEDCLTWGNVMGSLNWRHTFSNAATLSQSLYFTHYDNRLSITMEDLNARLTSAISAAGYKADYRYRWLVAGAEFSNYTVKPQGAAVDGSLSVKPENFPGDVTAQEASIYADATLQLAPRWMLRPGVRATAYLHSGRVEWALDPSVALEYSKDSFYAMLTASTRHQYVFQTGFSSIGLPTESWMPCDAVNRPQYSLNISAEAGTDFLDGAWGVRAELYYKRLGRQMEYDGAVYDFLNGAYDFNSSILHGKGCNYGADIMLMKRKGRLRGWIAYSVGRALRTYSEPRLNGTFPANHERIHELNILATLRVARRWRVGGTFVFASGSCITVPEYFYLFNGNIISQFSDHNGFRLKPYSKLDLSVNYQLRSTRLREQGINFSVYNALMSDNELFYSWSYDAPNEKLNYKPVSFVLRIMPSISYYLKF